MTMRIREPNQTSQSAGILSVKDIYARQCRNEQTLHCRADGVLTVCMSEHPSTDSSTALYVIVAAGWWSTEKIPAWLVMWDISPLKLRHTGLASKTASYGATHTPLHFSGSAGFDQITMTSMPHRIQPSVSSPSIIAITQPLLYFSLKSAALCFMSIPDANNNACYLLLCHIRKSPMTYLCLRSAVTGSLRWHRRCCLLCCTDTDAAKVPLSQLASNASPYWSYSVWPLDGVLL